jgi:rubredoxin
MPNTNCLKGLRCPICGNDKHLYIQSDAVMYVTDDGAECRGDTEWNDDSHAECPDCERSGPLRQFRATKAEAA